MTLLYDQLRLRIYLNAVDETEGENIYKTIEKEAIRLQLTNFSIHTKDSPGYVPNPAPYAETNLDLSKSLPILIEIIDIRHNVEKIIKNLAPILSQTIKGYLITSELITP